MCTKRCACPSVVRPIIMTRSVFPAAATTDDWTISHNDRLEPWKLQSLLFFSKVFIFFHTISKFPQLCTLPRWSSVLGLVWQCPSVHVSQPLFFPTVFLPWNLLTHICQHTRHPHSTNKLIAPSPAKLWHLESDLVAHIYKKYTHGSGCLNADVWMQHICPFFFPFSFPWSSF